MLRGVVNAGIARSSPQAVQPIARTLASSARPAPASETLSRCRASGAPVGRRETGRGSSTWESPRCCWLPTGDVRGRDGGPVRARGPARAPGRRRRARPGPRQARPSSSSSCPPTRTPPARSSSSCPPSWRCGRSSRWGWGCIGRGSVVELHRRPDRRPHPGRHRRGRSPPARPAARRRRAARPRPGGAGRARAARRRGAGVDGRGHHGAPAGAARRGVRRPAAPRRRRAVRVRRGRRGLPARSLPRRRAARARDRATGEAAWVLVPPAARPAYRCRRYSRVFVVPIRRQVARAVRWSDGGTLESYLLDQGARSWPVQARGAAVRGAARSPDRPLRAAPRRRRIGGARSRPSSSR